MIFFSKSTTESNKPIRGYSTTVPKSEFAPTRSPGASGAARGQKLPSALAGFLRSARVDDEMRQFLVGAVEQLSNITEGSIEVPVSIIRAINDVERIAMIEESAMPAEKQTVLRLCVLQIARLAGENG